VTTGHSEGSAFGNSVGTSIPACTAQRPHAILKTTNVRG
jgi:hypothetical protein